MIKGVLLDLAGTVHVGDTVIPGAVEAVQRLERARVPWCFVTNTTRRTRKTLHRDLGKMGFDIPEERIFAAPIAVRRYLEQHRLRPYLLIHPNLMPEFDGISREEPNAVVVGDAADEFTYRKMNEAFRVLKRGAVLISMGRSRYFEGDEGLELDVGPYVAALEYAAQATAIILGKPAADFFHEAAAQLGVDPADCVMIGDDAESDIAAALAAGMQGFLVQTGKYREGDEMKIGGDFLSVKDAAAAIEVVVGGSAC